MEADRTRWDAKYQASTQGDPAEPDPFVLRCLDREAVAGRAVDLAAGLGRHALELARRGWQVEAWDVSAVGLARLAESAAAAGLEVGTRRVDLEEDLPGDRRGIFDLALIVNYLDRDLTRRVARWLAPGGRLVVATFTTERAGRSPSVRHCLAPQELAEGLQGFQTLDYEEGAGRAGWYGRVLG